MPFLETLSGAPIVGSVVNLFTSLIDRVVPNEADREKAKLALLEMQQKGELAELDAEIRGMLAQTEVNKAEAESGNAYAANWRPTVGYICCAGLAYNYLFHPLLLWFVALKGGGVTPPPPISADLLYPLVFGMLGIGGMRSWERVKIGVPVK